MDAVVSMARGAGVGGEEEDGAVCDDALFPVVMVRHCASRLRSRNHCAVFASWWRLLLLVDIIICSEWHLASDHSRCGVSPKSSGSVVTMAGSDRIFEEVLDRMQTKLDHRDAARAVLSRTPAPADQMRQIIDNVSFFNA